MKVALFDYGAGNLHSLGKALAGGGAEVHVTTRWEEALSRDALVLPGVGAFSAAVEALPPDPTPIREALEEGLPCLGICLGMQLFFERSEEGEGEGLGLIRGAVRRIEADVVPQMGWNDVEVSDDPVWAGVGPGGGERDGSGDFVAYYANSFVCRPEEEGVSIGWSVYGGRRFTAAVRKHRSWGVQFHPEKSSAPGRRIIENFVRLAGEAPR